MASHEQGPSPSETVSKTGGAVNIERKVEDEFPEAVKYQNDAAPPAAPPPHVHEPLGTKIKHTLRNTFGIGKDDPPGGVVDPHPEVTVESGSGMDGWTERAKAGMHSTFGNPKAMEKDSPQLEAAIQKAHERAMAEEDRRGGGPIDVHKSSNVEKLSPFSGPVKEDPVGPQLGAVSPRTGGVPASRVQAPGFFGRMKEEVEALGEAAKSIVTGKS